jgi:excisionase family DNA binding protein
MENTIPSGYITAAEAAEYLKLAEGTVRNMARLGEIPSVTFGRSRRFTREALHAWVEAQNAAPVEGAAA